MRGRGGRGGRGGGSRGSMPPLTMPGEEKGAKPALKPTIEKPPELYPPIPNFPVPPAIDATHKALLDKSRGFNDFYRFSGYNVAKKQGLDVERYTDRYRRIPGRRDFFDEQGAPSTQVFPKELITQEDRSRKATMAPYELSATALMALAGDSFLDNVDMLVRSKISRPDDIDDAEKDEDEDDEKKREGDEEEEYQEFEDDEDEMGGGDYTANYEDADEDDDDKAFGEDEGDTL